jgi:hypothetical protein
MKTRWTLRSTALLMFAAMLAPACTIIRYRDPPDAGPQKPEEPAGEVDLLVFVDVDPSSANVGNAWGQALAELRASLQKRTVTVRSVAVAPLHHRVGSTVPLIAGQATDVPELGALVGAYTTQGSADFLVDTTHDEYSNVLDLGASLGSTPVYGYDGHPVDGQPFFGEPTDGLVVVVLTNLSPRCGLDDDCVRAASEHAQILSEVSPETGHVAWLSMAQGSGLPPSKVVTVLAGTPEVESASQMATACTAHAQFPSAVLDSLEPSRAYRSVVASQASEAGAPTLSVDLCAWISGGDRARTSAEIAANVEAALRAP